MAAGMASGMTRIARYLRDIDTERVRRDMPQAVGRGIEQHVGIGRQGQPCIIEHFILELAAAPTGVTQRDNIVSGNVVAARNFAKNNNTPVARIIDKGIQRIGKPLDSIEKSMDNVGQLEMYKLEKNLGVLSVISKAAPIFGFVGTLMGLMQMFSGITSSNEFDVSTISGGIYTKLITSITGLSSTLTG